MPLSGNRGEWSEIYIFLKLMCDRRVHAADQDMNKLDDVFLNIVKIIREEIRSNIYDYYPGDIIKIHLNGCDTNRDMQESEFANMRDRVYSLMEANPTGNIEDSCAESFLGSIYIEKLKASAFSTGDFFGGTQDITMQVLDYRSGISRVVGFSCKSDFAGRATLFNASTDNTNFVYEITGPISDTLMDSVNAIFKEKNVTDKDTGEPKTKQDIAIGNRIRALKDAGCDLVFVAPFKRTAERNLVLSGGTELPKIVGEALKHYYWVGEGRAEYNPISRAIEYVSASNPAGYCFDDIESIYRRKFSSLLYDMFTGMRLGSVWDGQSSVNGGYIVMKDDGDVVAYHSCIADEFKDFLLSKLAFESPGAGRHRYLEIYKCEGKYYIKFNLQVRFA